jgi:hypothetical protein
MSVAAQVCERHRAVTAASIVDCGPTFSPRTAPRGVNMDKLWLYLRYSCPVRTNLKF